jgi:hypothetical protein
MSKHIIDGPRKRDSSEKLERYTKLDGQSGEKVAPQTEALRREARARKDGERLSRYTKIERRED